MGFGLVVSQHWAATGRCCSFSWWCKHSLPISTSQPCDTGNIQKKLTDNSEGGRWPERAMLQQGQRPGSGAEKRGRLQARMTAGSANGHPGGRRGAAHSVAADSCFPGRRAAAGPWSPVQAGLSPPGQPEEPGQWAVQNGQFTPKDLAVLAPWSPREVKCRRSEDLRSNRAANYLQRETAVAFKIVTGL